MVHKLMLTRRLVVILAVWICVWGMAAVDLFDLTDELVHPTVNLGQVLEPELDDLDDAGLGGAVVRVAERDAFSLREAPGFVNAVGSSGPVSPRPLYQQLTQYRI